MKSLSGLELVSIVLKVVVAIGWILLGFILLGVIADRVTS